MSNVYIYTVADVHVCQVFTATDVWVVDFGVLTRICEIDINNEKMR